MVSGRPGTARRPAWTGPRGFTLIELVVVLTLIGLLISIAAPRYFHAVDRGRQTVQRQNLSTLRDAIDKFFGDQGRYPNELGELVSLRYLREIPLDPVSERRDWVVLPPEDVKLGAVYDVQPSTPPEGGAAAPSPPAASTPGGTAGSTP